MDCPHGLREGVPGVLGVHLLLGGGGGLGLRCEGGLGRKAMPWKNPPKAPRFAAARSNTPTPITADHVGIHTYVCPSASIFPSPNTTRQWHRKRKCGVPAFFTSEVTTLYSWSSPSQPLRSAVTVFHATALPQAAALLQRSFSV